MWKEYQLRKKEKQVTNTYTMNFNTPKIPQKISWLYNGEGQAIHIQTIVMLQMQKIWPPWG